MSITLRTEKGSELTHGELDDNFEEFDTSINPNLGLPLLESRTGDFPPTLTLKTNTKISITDLDNNFNDLKAQLSYVPDIVASVDYFYTGYPMPIDVNNYSQYNWYSAEETIDIPANDSRFWVNPNEVTNEYTLYVEEPQRRKAGVTKSLTKRVNRSQNYSNATAISAGNGANTSGTISVGTGEAWITYSVPQETAYMSMYVTNLTWEREQLSSATATRAYVASNTFWGTNVWLMDNGQMTKKAVSGFTRGLEASFTNANDPFGDGSCVDYWSCDAFSGTDIPNHVRSACYLANATTMFDIGIDRFGQTGGLDQKGYGGTTSAVAQYHTSDSDFAFYGEFRIGQIYSGGATSTTFWIGNAGTRYGLQVHLRWEASDYSLRAKVLAHKDAEVICDYLITSTTTPHQVMYGIGVNYTSSTSSWDVWVDGTQVVTGYSFQMKWAGLDYQIYAQDNVSVVYSTADEFRIFNRPLTNTEHGDLFDRLVAYYDFNEDLGSAPTYILERYCRIIIDGEEYIPPFQPTYDATVDTMFPMFGVNEFTVYYERPSDDSDTTYARYSYDY